MENEDLGVYESYLQNLNKMNEYNTFLETRNNNISSINNIKLFFYNHVHISIIDYMNENYVLHPNINALNTYIKTHPNKKMYKKKAKQLNMDIFLKDLKELYKKNLI